MAIDQPEQPERKERHQRITKDGGEFLNMSQAAEHLGFTIAGMRKLVERSKQRLRGLPVRGPTITFFQPFPGSDIRFRRKWLEDFVRRCTHNPDEVPLMTPTAKQKPKKATPDSLPSAMSESGFDPSLLNL